ncbi:hypothetical protein ABGN05_13625 [Aquibium sp. LZ166]|uniref:Uncharacterized protein n=1 Tax=Aquibium pacificus TaxID=3153579 RepID=A0ABV3SIX1_9HYPH
MKRTLTLAGVVLAFTSFTTWAQETDDTATNAVLQATSEASATPAGWNGDVLREELASKSLAAIRQPCRPKATDSLVGDLGDVGVLLHKQVI